MASGTYTWLTMAQAVQQLSQRLVDPTNQLFTAAEVQIYIEQSLRMYNVLTWQWRTDFTFNNLTPNLGAANVWSNLGSLPQSPRIRSILDTYCYTELEYLLLEPPSGQVWTGTSQFTLSDLSQALQRRRDEVIQVSNCNQSLMQNIQVFPNTLRTQLPDSVIDVERVRYRPVVGPPNTLYRDDTVAQEFYEAPLYQMKPGTPQTFSLSSEPPLSWQVDVPPNEPGTYEAVVMQSGAPFNPPTPTLIGIPNDFAWVLEWGALADLLGRESEATDRERAAYAMQRYQDGLQLMLKTPWIELGKVNGQAVSLDSIYALDRYSPEWDSNPVSFGPVIVVGGIDLVGTPVNAGISVTVLGNAPILDNTNTYVQVSRSNWDVVLDLAQARGSFKFGGAEWKAALELEQRAIQACAAENSRLKSMGAFSDILDQRGMQQERDMNRYNSANKGQ